MSETPGSGSRGQGPGSGNPRRGTAGGGQERTRARGQQPPRTRPDAWPSGEGRRALGAGLQRSQLGAGGLGRRRGKRGCSGCRVREPPRGAPRGAGLSSRGPRGAGGRGAGEGRSSEAGAAAAARRVCGGCCGRARGRAPLRDRDLGTGSGGPRAVLAESPSSRGPTADGPALSQVREPGPGRQVGPRAARRAGGTRPRAGGAVAGLGAAGSGGQTKGAGPSSSALEALGAGQGASPVTRPNAPRQDPAAHSPAKGRWDGRLRG